MDRQFHTVKGSFSAKLTAAPLARYGLSGYRRGVRRLDDMDLRIITALQSDGRKAYRQIADDLGVSQSVVRYRVQRLEQAGVLQIVAVADPLKVGFDHMALIGVRVRAGTARAVCKQVSDLPETSYVVMVAGSYDVVVEAICRDSAHFAEFLTDKLQTIDGVVSTESLFVLDIYKLAYGWDVVEAAEAGDRSDVTGER